MPVYLWSQTAASNATSDPTINWAEGQAPSSVNDSGRAVNAAIAKYRDDISGAIVTGGSATAYTVASFSVFDTLAHLNGAMIAFTPHATNTGSAGCTLNVDGLGAKALRSSPSVELFAGTLVLGTPYVATYNNSDGAWYLRNFFGNPYNTPLGGAMLYFGASAPNSAFVFPFGQAISRATYAGLFSLIGSTFGGGDGSTTFNLPDLRGRVVAGADNMGGSAANRLTTTSGMSSGALGGTGGTETELLTLSQLPTGITSANTGAISLNVASTVSNITVGLTTPSVAAGGNVISTVTAQGQVLSTGTIAIGSAAVTSNNTSGSVHPNVQPTYVSNIIMRVI